MPGTLAWQRRSLDDSCQGGKMAALFKSTVSDIMIILIHCNWCVSLDFAQMLALGIANTGNKTWQEGDKHLLFVWFQ